MKLEVFSVYDSKTAVYSHPFFTVSLGAALRAFSDCLLDNNHPFSRHPGDYSLYHLGSFDDSTATFEPFVHKVNLGTALEHMARLKKEAVEFQEEGEE